MSEITKLYENAGIKPERQDCCKIADKYWANNTESGFEYLMQKECPYNQECTDECEYAYDKVKYPPFTVEKQIELIKLLARNEMLCRLEDEYPYFERFEECIAYIINYLWQSLTEEEKQQVKGILE